MGLAASLRTLQRPLSRIQQLQDHFCLVWFHLPLVSVFTPFLPFPFVSSLSTHRPFRSTEFLFHESFVNTCLGSFSPHTFFLFFPGPAPIDTAEVWGGFSLEADAGKVLFEATEILHPKCSTSLAECVFLFPWRADTKGGESRAVKQGKERDEIPVICLLQPSPISWGRKQPSAAEKTLLRFIALADSQQKNPKKWWGRLQEQTVVWETDPPAKNQTGQQRGKDLKSPSPFLIH